MAQNPFEKPVTDFELVTPKRGKDGGGPPAVILERIEPGVVPEYCTHGKAPCLWCQDWCWLGSETYKIVKSGDAAPMCLDCATRLLPPGARPSGSVRDHRRADGPR